jgi:hypothetical protein
MANQMALKILSGDKACAYEPGSSENFIAGSIEWKAVS